MYSCTLSLTSMPDGSGQSTLCPSRFTPGKDPVPNVQEDEWAPRPVWLDEENLAPHWHSIPGPSSP